MSFESWSLKKRLTLTFAAILVVAGTLFGIAVANIAKMRSATEWNTHTYKVLAEGQAMLLNMVNIETGLRGFIASGEANFLDPLKSGQAAFGEHHAVANRHWVPRTFARLEPANDLVPVVRSTEIALEQMPAGAALDRKGDLVGGWLVPA